VKHIRQIVSLFMLLLIIGLYTLILGYSQVSFAESSVHPLMTKTTIVRSQHHTQKTKAPLPNHRKCSTTHILAIYPLYQFHTLGYFPATYHFSISTLVAKIQTNYCFVNHYQVSKSIYSLRAPPVMA
jgi:hypothetical protein